MPPLEDEKGDVMHVRLTRKLALALNGLDLSKTQVGDVMELPKPIATMLLAEGWAEPTSEKPSLAPNNRQNLRASRERG